MSCNYHARMDDARLAAMRHELSPARRDGEGRVRVFALGIGPGVFSPPRPLGWDHVVTTRTGGMVLRGADAATTITPAIAVRVPGDGAYALDIRTRCDLRIVFTPASRALGQRFGAFAMTPLLRESVERAVVVGYLDPKIARHANVLAVIEDELSQLRDAPPATTLRIPRDPTLRASIERCLTTSDDIPTIPALAASVHVSVRTLERQFARETGVTPRAWLRRARLMRAAMALTVGTTVTDAGLENGYTSTSAFICAYRSLFNVTPGKAANASTRSRAHNR